MGRHSIPDPDEAGDLYGDRPDATDSRDTGGWIRVRPPAGTAR